MGWGTAVTVRRSRCIRMAGRLLIALRQAGKRTANRLNWMSVRRPPCWVKSRWMALVRWGKLLLRPSKERTSHWGSRDWDSMSPEIGPESPGGQIRSLIHLR